MNCSACEETAQPIQVHGYDLCPAHASGLMIAVLVGDYTPVGYILAASCGMEEVIDFNEPVVSVTETRRSPFMQHGAIPALPQPMGASSISDKPEPLRAHQISEHRTVKVTRSQWREVNS